MTRSAQRGFNLIEIMVSLTVLAVLIFARRAELRRVAAEPADPRRDRSGRNGMQVARGEAIKRNLAVQLTLDPPSGWDVCEATKQPCDSTLLADPVKVQDVIQAGPAGKARATQKPTPRPTGRSR